MNALKPMRIVFSGHDTALYTCSVLKFPSWLQELCQQPGAMGLAANNLLKRLGALLLGYGALTLFRTDLEASHHLAARVFG